MVFAWFWTVLGGVCFQENAQKTVFCFTICEKKNIFLIPEKDILLFWGVGWAVFLVIFWCFFDGFWWVLAVFGCVLMFFSLMFSLTFDGFLMGFFVGFGSLWRVF